MSTPAIPHLHIERVDGEITRVQVERPLLNKLFGKCEIHMGGADGKPVKIGECSAENIKLLDTIYERDGHPGDIPP